MAEYLTYEHFYALGKTFVKGNNRVLSEEEIEEHVFKCPAILKQAFLDGVEDQSRVFWPAWPYQY